MIDECSGCPPSVTKLATRMRSPVVWYLLTSLLRVLHAGPSSPDPSPECSDGDVRLLTSFSENDVISDALSGVLGDVHGTLEVCEDQLWKKLVLCVNAGGGEQWTVENTAVACRDRGYTAPGESGANNFQSIESSRRLSYIPQCIGSEERLRDCSAVDQDDSCDAPLVISCWNSSEVMTSQPSISLTISSPAPFTSSLGNTPVFSSTALLSTNTAVPNTVIPSSDPHQPLPTSTPSLNSSSIDTSTAPQPLIYLASAVGSVVAILTVSISVVLFYIACHQRRGRVRPTDGPYEVSITTAGSNPTFDTVPETEALYDRATTSVLHRQEEEEESREYHTLNHSLSHTKPSPPLSGHSTGSSTGPPPVYNTVASSGANPARDPPSQNPPVYYHVLQNPSGRAEEVKYHTLEEPPGHRYHVLEQTGETNNTASGGCTMYSEVGQRRAATLQPHQHPPSSSNPNISLPRNLSRSTTLL